MEKTAPMENTAPMEKIGRFFPILRKDAYQQNAITLCNAEPGQASYPLGFHYVHLPSTAKPTEANVEKLWLRHHLRH
jgi:hypothetical protein